MMPQQPGARETRGQPPGGMAVAVVGVHDPYPALTKEAGKTQRLGQHEAGVVQTGAVEIALAGRRLEADAECPKQVRERTFELMQRTTG